MHPSTSIISTIIITIIMIIALAYRGQPGRCDPTSRGKKYIAITNHRGSPRLACWFPRWLVLGADPSVPPPLLHGRGEEGPLSSLVGPTPPGRW